MTIYGVIYIVCMIIATIGFLTLFMVSNVQEPENPMPGAAMLLLAFLGGLFWIAIIPVMALWYTSKGIANRITNKESVK